MYKTFAVVSIFLILDALCWVYFMEIILTLKNKILRLTWVICISYVHVQKYDIHIQKWWYTCTKQYDIHIQKYDIHLQEIWYTYTKNVTYMYKDICQTCRKKVTNIIQKIWHPHTNIYDIHVQKMWHAHTKNIRYMYKNVIYMCARNMAYIYKKYNIYV